MEKFCNEAFFRFFNALANRTNLAIIDLLAESEKTDVEIADFFGQNPELISRNLQQMRSCALLRQNGKSYSINKEILAPLDELVAFHTNKHCPGLRECIPEAKLKEYLKRQAAEETYIEH